MDVTLTDYAADLQAPTSTATAEFAVPERVKFLQDVRQIFSRLNFLTSNELKNGKLRLQSSRIMSIRGTMSEKMQLTDHVFDLISGKMREIFSGIGMALAKMALPRPTVEKNVDDVFRRMVFWFNGQLENRKNLFAIAANGLESNRPFKSEVHQKWHLLIKKAD
jgi:exonuclease VII large subunit